MQCFDSFVQRLDGDYYRGITIKVGQGGGIEMEQDQTETETPCACVMQHAYVRGEMDPGTYESLAYLAGTLNVKQAITAFILKEFVAAAGGADERKRLRRRSHGL